MSLALNVGQSVGMVWQRIFGRWSWVDQIFLPKTTNIIKGEPSLKENRCKFEIDKLTYLKSYYHCYFLNFVSLTSRLTVKTKTFVCSVILVSSHHWKTMLAKICYFKISRISRDRHPKVELSRSSRLQQAVSLKKDSLATVFPWSLRIFPENLFFFHSLWMTTSGII